MKKGENSMSEDIQNVEKKTKVIYLVELLVFVVLFAVLATLELLGVIGNKEVMHTIFNWVTIFGGTWMIVDFLWVLISKKRRAKNSLLDKALLVPAGIYLITFDIMCFCKLSFIDIPFRRTIIAALFYYFAAIYLFQAIYHWFFPIPSLVKAIEDTKEAMRKEQEELQKQQEEGNDANMESDPNIGPDDHPDNSEGTPSD